MNGTEAALHAIKKTEEVITKQKIIENSLFRIEEKITKIYSYLQTAPIIQHSGTISKVSEKENQEKIDYDEIKKMVVEALLENLDKLNSGEIKPASKTTSSNPKKAYIPRIRIPDNESSSTIKLDDD